MSELQKKLQIAENSSDYDVLMDFLSAMRKEKLRRSDVVAKKGFYLLQNYRRRLGDEIWAIYEQVFIAALDIHDATISAFCLKPLKNQFPNSSRVKRLIGMELEQRGDYTAAEALYAEVLEENPANGLIMKRRVAISKSQGKINEAISRLNAYLKIFQTDASAWLELADIYLSIGNYKCAAFCFEEIVLSNPINFLYHSRLAEIYMSMGGLENLRYARKHFVQSVEFNSHNNPRALIGIIMSTRAIAGLKMAKSDKDDLLLNQRTHEKAIDALTSLYANNASPEIAELARIGLEATASVIVP